MCLNYSGLLKKYSSIPLKWSRVVDIPCSCLKVSGQEFYEIHVVGLVGTLISPEGPTNKYLN